MEEKKTGIMTGGMMASFIAGLVLAIIGFVRIPWGNRVIIYAVQGAFCAFMIVQGLRHLKDGDRKYLRIALYIYTCIEALRTTLLITIGVNTIVGYVARFLLIIMACDCVLIAERMDKPEGVKIAISLLILEVVLYLLFLFGFPGIMLGRLNRFLPLIGVLTAVGIVLGLKSRTTEKE